MVYSAPAEAAERTDKEPRCLDDLLCFAAPSCLCSD
jgi:hypothetical protein